MISVEEYIKRRKKIDLRQALFFSIVTGALLFVFLVGVSPGGAFITGILGFAFIFVLVYGLTSLQGNGALKKLQKYDTSQFCFEANFVGEEGSERGLVTLLDHSVLYQPLTRMSMEKAFEIPINEDLFMAFGDVKLKMFHKLRFGDVTQSHLTLREMPLGPLRQFVFYNIDNLEDYVGERLNQISQFNAEKYQ